MLAGISTGLLLGILVGLSVSSVVGSVIGGIVALLATFLGLKDDAAAPAPPGPGADPAAAPAAPRPAADPAARRYAVTGFGFACLFGVIAGLVLRTHDVLAMSPRDQVKQWTDAGYKPDEAMKIVALRSAGIVPKDVTIAAGTPASGSHGVLFAADARYCDQLRPEDYRAAEDLRGAFAVAGGAWKDYGDVVARLPGDSTQLALLRAAWGLVCRPGSRP